MLWACLWCALDRFGGSETCWGHAFGMLLGCLGVLGVPWRSLGVLQVALGRSLGVLGSFWGALGVILEVWGDPWISPGKSECCYFNGFRWYSEMSCFLMIFHINLEVTMFSRNMQKLYGFYIDFMRSKCFYFIGFGFVFEFHMFSQVRFLQISLNISMEKTCASVEPQRSKQWKCE